MQTAYDEWLEESKKVLPKVCEPGKKCRIEIKEEIDEYMREEWEKVLERISKKFVKAMNETEVILKEEYEQAKKCYIHQQDCCAKETNAREIETIIQEWRKQIVTKETYLKELYEYKEDITKVCPRVDWDVPSKTPISTDDFEDKFDDQIDQFDHLIEDDKDTEQPVAQPKPAPLIEVTPEAPAVEENPVVNPAYTPSEVAVPAVGIATGAPSLF